MGSDSAIDVDALRGLTSDDIASFKASGLAVRLRSESLGELWLVPAYTGGARLEITPEHVATVMRALTVFPDARIVGFESSSSYARTTPSSTYEAESSSSRKGNEHESGVSP